MSGLRIVYDSPFTATSIFRDDPLSLFVLSKAKEFGFSLDPLVKNVLFICGTDLEKSLAGIEGELKKNNSVLVLDFFDNPKKSLEFVERLLSSHTFQRLTGYFQKKEEFSGLDELFEVADLLINRENIQSHMELKKKAIENYLSGCLYKGKFEFKLAKILELAGTSEKSRKKSIELFTNNLLKPSFEKELEKLVDAKFTGIRPSSDMNKIGIIEIKIDPVNLECKVVVSVETT